MKKSYTLTLISGTLALALAMPTHAEAQQQRRPASKIKLTLPKPAPKHKGKKSHAKAQAILKSAGDGRELWGNLANADSWGYDDHSGIYAFDAAAPLTMDKLGAEGADANAGSALVGDRLYVMNVNNDQMFPILTLSTYDTKTWQKAAEDVQTYNSRCWAWETAVAKDGTVWGVFLNADLDGYEFGTIDYSGESPTRTSNIGAASRAYVALGISSKNVLYGVGDDGNLYSIDTATGKETLVGPTGLKLKGDGPLETFWYQSGEIDPATDTFYWAAADVDDKRALYIIDLATGKADKVADFNDGEDFRGLYIPAIHADAAAPAMPTGLGARFEGGSMEGKVVFIMPATTFGGDALTGSLGYSVSVNGVEVAAGAAEAGAEVQADVALDEEGVAKFAVKASNDKGEGPEARTATFVGFDTPKAVSGATFTYDRASATATVAWRPTEGGIYDGFIGDVTYTVTRHPGNTEAYAGATAAFAETLSPDVTQATYYTITATSHGKASRETATGKQVTGPALQPPYRERFDFEEKFDLFTVLDLNGDGRTWYHKTDVADPAATCLYSWLDADDWLITPPIALKKGQTYKLGFSAEPYDGHDRVERLEVKLGDAPTAEAMTETLLPPTDLDYVGKERYEKEITPTEDGEYYIGFHSISPANRWTISIDDITLEQTTGISQAEAEDGSGQGKAVGIYTIDGKAAAKGAQATRQLSKGIYIIDGKKTAVK